MYLLLLTDIWDKIEIVNILGKGQEKLLLQCMFHNGITMSCKSLLKQVKLLVSNKDMNTLSGFNTLQQRNLLVIAVEYTHKHNI